MKIEVSEVERSGVYPSNGHFVDLKTAPTGSHFYLDRAIVLALFGSVLAILAVTRPLIDFVAFWSSAHELAAGHNPYSIVGMLRAERAAGWIGPLPLMNLNPPWSLPFVAPLAVSHSYRLAWFAWASALAFIVFASTALLLRFYSPERPAFVKESFLTQGLLATSFVPALYAVKMTNTNCLLLAGLAGFLWFERQNRFKLAGASLAVVAIKPHLVLLLWPALLWSSWQKRTWSTLLSLLATICALTGAAMAMRPRVIFDFMEFSKNTSVNKVPSAIGGILRFAIGGNTHFWLQFLAPTLGLTWFFFYWLPRKRGGWSWGEEMPILLTVSVLCSAFGWMHDGVVLLLPIAGIVAREVKAAGSISRKTVVLYSAVNLAILAAVEATAHMPFAAMSLMYPIAPLGVLYALRGR